MRANIPAEMRELLEMRNYAGRLVGKGEYEEAERHMRHVCEVLRAKGWGGAEPMHLLSYIFFKQNRLDEALELVLEALAQDPVNPKIHYSFDVLMQQMRETIERADLPADDPRISRYYEILARESETTVETHLAMLRHLCAVGKVEEARRIADAAAVLSPGHPEVWRIRATLMEGEEGEAGNPATALAGMLPPGPMAKA